jgi:uncharacterized protein
MPDTIGRHITVTGHGTATGTPDIAEMQFGVRTFAPTAEQALDDNNLRMQALLGRLQQLGIADGDLRTTTIDVHSRQNNAGEIDGYEVNNRVTATIRQIERLGTIVSAVAAGDNINVWGPTLHISDRAALEAEALAAAIADARARAEAIARATGTLVGSIIAVSEGGGGGGPEPRMLAAREARATPVQPGTQMITVGVQVSYAIVGES